MRLRSGLFLALLLAPRAWAQLSLGPVQNPPSLRWKELSSEHFRVVFPEELAADAQACANVLEHVRAGLARGFESEVPRTTLVLSNQQGAANGYVGFFPRRSEWFHVAPADALLGANEWYSLLAVHEGRHMAQIAEEKRGSVLAAWVLAGEVGQALMMLGLGAPTWYIEGDAVLSETLLSASGRGRSPAFQRPLRTAALEDDLPTYRQAVFGSYRRGFVNPYELGYYLVTRIQRDFGAEAAGEILRGAGRWAAIPGAFDRNVMRVTGMSAVDLYRSTMEELERLWREQAAGLPVTPVRPLIGDAAAAERDRASYLFPSRVPGGTVAIKTSLSQSPAIVLIDGLRPRARAARRPDGRGPRCRGRPRGLAAALPGRALGQPQHRRPRRARPLDRRAHAPHARPRPAVARGLARRQARGRGRVAAGPHLAHRRLRRRRDGGRAASRGAGHAHPVAGVVAGRAAPVLLQNFK